LCSHHMAVLGVLMMDHVFLAQETNILYSCVHYSR
jgi:hypothetical protein